MKSITILAFAAALATALANGIAAVLQKIGADKQETAGSMNPELLWSLLQNWTYMLGIGLDFTAWILTLVAVQSLPLFVVQPIIAGSVTVTAVVEHFIFKRPLNRRMVLAIALIVLGLVVLAWVAQPEHATKVSQAVYWSIVLAPIGLVALGAVFSRSRKASGTVIIAALGGLGFAGVSIAGRLLTFSAPYIHIIYQPLTLSLVIDGILGIFLFTIALQRSSATAVNAITVVSQTLSAGVVGVTFLGDEPRNHLWPAAAAGALLVLAGTAAISLAGSRPNHKSLEP